VLGARAAGGAEMLADLPLGELANARWRLELTLPAAGGGKRVPLPPVLEPSANSGTVVTSLAAAAADPAAKPGRGQGARGARIRRPTRAAVRPEARGGQDPPGSEEPKPEEPDPQEPALKK
jgi:hypothetical protein